MKIINTIPKDVLKEYKYPCDEPTCKNYSELYYINLDRNGEKKYLLISESDFIVCLGCEKYIKQNFYKEKDFEGL